MTLRTDKNISINMLYHLEIYSLALMKDDDLITGQTKNFTSHAYNPSRHTDVSQHNR